MTNEEAIVELKEMLHHLKEYTSGEGYEPGYWPFTTNDYLLGLRLIEAVALGIAALERYTAPYIVSNPPNLPVRISVK